MTIWVTAPVVPSIYPEGHVTQSISSPRQTGIKCSYLILVLKTHFSFLLKWSEVQRLQICNALQLQNGRKGLLIPPDSCMCTRIGRIYIIKRRALSGDVFPSSWALNPSYAFVYLFATFRCLLLTCVNQSCESEWCVDSHASVSIWLSQQLNGEMPELMPLDKWAGSAVAGEGNTLPAGRRRAVLLCDDVRLDEGCTLCTPCWGVNRGFCELALLKIPKEMLSLFIYSWYYPETLCSSYSIHSFGWGEERVLL